MVGRHLACDVVVTYRNLWYVVEIYIAEDTAHAEHVLALEVRAVAPTEHLHGKLVLALLQVVCDVKLSNVVRALCVTYVFAVEPYECRRVDTAEVDECAAAVPILGNLECADV